MLPSLQVAAAGSAAQLHRASHRLSENEVEKAILHLRNDIAQDHSIVGFGDYHDDDELKIFFINILPHLQKAGYRKFCVEYPAKHQQKLREALKLFLQEQIGFGDLKRVTCEHDGRQYWNFTGNSQNLFTTMIARAAKLGMEIVAMDTEFTHVGGHGLRERNDLWVSRIHEDCDLNSKEKIVIFGGAFHFNGPNTHSDTDVSECESATGVDRLIATQFRHRKFTIFTAPQRALRTHEKRSDYEYLPSVSKVDDYYGTGYHFLHLPALRQNHIEESIETALGLRLTRDARTR